MNTNKVESPKMEWKTEYEFMSCVSSYLTRANQFILYFLNKNYLCKQKEYNWMMICCCCCCFLHRHHHWRERDSFHVSLNETMNEQAYLSKVAGSNEKSRRGSIGWKRERERVRANVSLNQIYVMSFKHQM